MTHKTYFEEQYWDNNPFNPATFRLFREWYTQNKPWRQPLPWSVDRRLVTRYQSNSPFGRQFVPMLQDALPSFSGLWDFTISKAYNKLTSAVGDSSGWGENLAEANQSIQTIVTRAHQLGQVASALRGGNIGSALDLLQHPDSSLLRQRLRKAKSFSNQWLELHFGWVPAITDISNSLNTLSKADFGLRQVKGSSTDKRESRFREDDGDQGFHTRVIETSVHTKFSLWVRINNPNAYLANQFGVANPLAVAWNLIPYSFVVDWFSNVGQCLGAMTDWVGLSREREQTNLSVKAVTTDHWFFRNTIPPNDPLFITIDSQMEGLFVDRITSVSGPNLTLYPFKGLSVTRGATAIALLLQKL